MKHPLLVLGATVMILSLLAGARVHADAIQWTASTSVTTGWHGGGTLVSNTYPGDSSDNVSINMSGLTTSGSNSASVALVGLMATMNGPTGLINTEFSGPSAQYKLSLLLSDKASGASGTLTFNGYLSGELNPGPSGSLTNTFVGPTTQTLKLGSNLYTATIGPVILPQVAMSQSGFSNLGSISASINAQPLTNSAPEPTSLVLACLGLPPLGLTGWFRRRRKAVDANANKA